MTDSRGAPASRISFRCLLNASHANVSTPWRESRAR
jgi:hypothetical protein